MRAQYFGTPCNGHSGWRLVTFPSRMVLWLRLRFLGGKAREEAALLQQPLRPPPPRDSCQGAGAGPGPSFAIGRAAPARSSSTARPRPRRAPGAERGAERALCLASPPAGGSGGRRRALSRHLLPHRLPPLSGAAPELPAGVSVTGSAASAALFLLPVRGAGGGGRSGPRRGLLQAGAVRGPRAAPPAPSAQHGTPLIGGSLFCRLGRALCGDAGRVRCGSRWG